MVNAPAAEHGDSLVRAQGPEQPVDRGLQVHQQEGITERREGGLQEARDGGRFCQTRAQQELGDHGRRARGAREVCHALGVDRRIIPAHFS